MKKILDLCPQKPNCVCTFESTQNKQAYMAPIKLGQNPIPTLLKAVKKKGWKIQNHSETYIHAVVESDLFKFKDDVEFLYTKDVSLLHYRSASRTGYWDMGANRKRMQEFFKSLNFNA